MLGQALADARNGDLVPSNWIGSGDFREVVDLAGLDPAAVREGFLRNLSRQAA